jgi:hypothetical protein
MLTALLVAVSCANLGAQTIVISGTQSTPTGTLRGEQLAPSVSLTRDGALVVWEDNTIDGTNGTGIAGRWLGSDLAPRSDVFRLNDQKTGDQLAPQAIALSGGTTLVTWQSRVKANTTVQARLLDPNGSFLTQDFQLNPNTTNSSYRYKVVWNVFNRNKYRKRTYRLKDTISNIRESSSYPVAAALPDGGAVIVYQSVQRYLTNSWGLAHPWRWTGSRNLTNTILVPTRSYVDWMQDVYFQRISATGAKVGPEVQVNQYANYNQRSPAVAVLPDGSFVVAWVSEHPRSFVSSDNFRVDLYARLFSSQGEPLGNEFKVNGDEGLICANPVAAPLATGGFTLAWSQQEAPLSRHWDVASRVYYVNGTPAGDITVVNVTRTGDQFAPKLASVGDNQLLVWTSRRQDGSHEGVYGRLLYGGAPAGEELRVNTTTISRQIQPAIAGEAQGRFLALWSSYAGQSGFDLASQSFAVPSSLAPAGGGGGFAEQQALMNGGLAAGVAGNLAAVPPTVSGAGAVTGTGPSTGPPLQLGLNGARDKLLMRWHSQPGARYQVETSTDLKTWSVLGEPRTATGATDSVELDGAVLKGAEPALFYRVTQLP